MAARKQTRLVDWLRRLELAPSKRGSEPSEPDTKPSTTVIVDNPIHDAKQDLLSRGHVAKAFVDDILALELQEGAVVGVVGPWGSGKTSFVNLTRGELRQREVPVLDFNPWMFSGTAELVDRFFVEICQQLKMKPGLKKLGNQIERYMGTFPGFLGGASRLLATVLQGSDLRAKVVATLEQFEHPIAVVVDDIDRLSTKEIRDIFRLVRMTGRFPNLVYVLAFDRLRVEKALDEDGVPGRDYLEKIVQWSIDLPAIPKEHLRGLLLDALDQALADIEGLGQLDDEAWIDILESLVRPLIRNIRDIRRYVASVRTSARALAGEVQLADVLGLEAIRTFLPTVFSRLHPLADVLTASDDFDFNSDLRSEERRAMLENLMESGSDKSDVVRSMLKHLFPATLTYLDQMVLGSNRSQKQWLRERRVARLEVLRLYLERSRNDKLQTFSHAEAAWAVMSDGPTFNRYLRDLDDGRLQDVIGSLEAFEDDFTAQHASASVTVLLNLLPDMPTRERGFFEHDTEMVVSRIVYRLIRSVGDAQHTQTVVRDILPNLSSFGAKLRLIEIVGHREGVGHGLVSTEAAAEMERLWRDEVRAATTESLRHEQDLLRVILAVERNRDQSEPVACFDLAALTIPILASARSEALHTSGYRVVREARLPWDLLVRLYGDEATLDESVEASVPVGESERGLAELARKYLDGWRPERGPSRA